MHPLVKEVVENLAAKRLSRDANLSRDEVIAEVTAEVDVRQYLVLTYAPTKSSGKKQVVAVQGGILGNNNGGAEYIGRAPRVADVSLLTLSEALESSDKQNRATVQHAPSGSSDVRFMLEGYELYASRGMLGMPKAAPPEAAPNGEDGPAWEFDPQQDGPVVAVEDDGN